MSVRLTDQDLLHPTIQLFVQRRITRIPQEMSHLQLEISEHAMSRATLQPMLAHWSRHGIRLAISPFGRTLEALGCLNSLPCERVILDPSLLDQLYAEKRSRRQLSSWIRSFESIGKPVICTHITSCETRDWLQEQGCRLQGGELLSPLESCSAFERRILGNPDRHMTGNRMSRPLVSTGPAVTRLVNPVAACPP